MSLDLHALNDAMFARPPVYAWRADLPELCRIAMDARKSADASLFLEEFDRLRVAQEADAQFVRLGSSVIYKDLRSKRRRCIRLVRPGCENADESEVSLLSPIGGALVGLAAGSVFRWVGLDGRLRAIKVLEIIAEDAK